MAIVTDIFMEIVYAISLLWLGALIAYRAKALSKELDRACAYSHIAELEADNETLHALADDFRAGLAEMEAVDAMCPDGMTILEYVTELEAGIALERKTIEVLAEKYSGCLSSQGVNIPPSQLILTATAKAKED